MAAATSSQGQQEITLLQERNTGTFARVYLAEVHSQNNVSRIVAVKILRSRWSQDPQLLSRTQDEARLLARLHHRNILRVEGLAALDGHPAIIMEFVDGVDLKQIIEDRKRPFPPRAAYQVARDTAAALDAAYFRAPYGRDEPLRVVHRDIKPSNIMISVEGDVKVLDFGTARYQNEIRNAHTGALRFGSLKYMSPERRDGDRGEHASDIYSLGVVLIEMLAGQLLPVIPIDQPSHDQLIRDSIAGLPDLGLPNAEWEASFRQTLQRMCAYQTEQRLDAPQVLQLLRAFADQATGPSLESFAAQGVRDLSERLYRDRDRGSLSGARLTVTLTSSGSYRGSLPIGDGAHHDTVTAAIEEHTTGATDPAALPAYTPPSPREAIRTGRTQPTAVQPEFSPSPTFDPEPGVGGGPSPLKESGFYHSDPPPADYSAEAEDVPGGGGGGGLGQRNLLLLGVIAALLGVILAFGLAAIIGGLIYWLAYPTPPTGPTPSEITAPDPPPLGDDLREVRLSADDDTIQWIKLKDDAGGTLFKADPSGVTDVPAGEYLVEAKIVARLQGLCHPHRGGGRPRPGLRPGRRREDHDLLWRRGRLSDPGVSRAQRVSALAAPLSQQAPVSWSHSTSKEPPRQCRPHRYCRHPLRGRS